jgi:hypothetical protein
MELLLSYFSIESGIFSIETAAASKHSLFLKTQSLNYVIISPKIRRDFNQLSS